MFLSKKPIYNLTPETNASFPMCVCLCMCVCISSGTAVLLQIIYLLAFYLNIAIGT